MKSSKVGEWTGKCTPVTCPVCDQEFEILVKDIPSTASLNCGKCGASLIIEEGVVYPFHEKLHEKDCRWPADGNNTDSVVIEEGDETSKE